MSNNHVFDLLWGCGLVSLVPFVLGTNGLHTLLTMI